MDCQAKFKDKSTIFCEIVTSDVSSGVDVIIVFKRLLCLHIMSNYVFIHLSNLVKRFLLVLLWMKLDRKCFRRSIGAQAIGKIS